MSQKQIYICLASGQQLQNYIPAQVFDPTHVFILTSDSYAVLQNAKTLASVFNKKGIPTELVTKMPSINIDSLFSFLQNFKAQFLATLDPATEIIVNVTGGTKPMSLACYEFFKAHFQAAKIIYNDHENNKIEYLSPIKQKSQPLGYDTVDLTTYFKLHGLTILEIASDDPIWQKRAKARKELTIMLSKNIGFADELRSFFGKNGQLEYKLSSKNKNKKIIQLGEQHQLFTYSFDRNTIRFPYGDKAQFYLTGGWLEEYTWLCLNDIGIENVKCGIKINWEDSSRAKDVSINELDITFLYHNQIFILECKTGKIDGINLQNTLNKLETIGRYVGGTFHGLGLVMLTEANDVLKERAERFRIKTFDHVQLLPQLPAQLEGWIKRTKK